MYLFKNIFEQISPKKKYVSKFRDIQLIRKWSRSRKDQLLAQPLPFYIEPVRSLTLTGWEVGAIINHSSPKQR